SLESAEFDDDLLKVVARWFGHVSHVLRKEGMHAAATVIRIHDERTKRSPALTHITRLFPELPPRSLEGFFPVFDEPRHEVEHLVASAVLVQALHEHLACRRESHDDCVVAQLHARKAIDMSAIGQDHVLLSD